MDKIPLTRIGHIKIKEQLQFLKSKERPMPGHYNPVYVSLYILCFP